MASRPARKIYAALAALQLCCGCALAADVAWPTLAIPEGVQSFPIDGDLAVNGLALRMRGIASHAPPATVAAAFRAALAPPLVETTHQGAQVLGKALGQFYLTVQLEPAGAGTRGIIAVTRPGAPAPGRLDAKPSLRYTPTWVPAGSALVSRTNSVDGQRRAESLALNNNLSVELNVAHLKRTLSAQGYALMQTASRQRHDSGTTLFFKRRDAETIAVVYRTPDGKSSIVLNTVTEPERTK